MKTALRCLRLIVGVYIVVPVIVATWLAGMLVSDRKR